MALLKRLMNLLHPCWKIVWVSSKTKADELVIMCLEQQSFLKWHWKLWSKHLVIIHIQNCYYPKLLTSCVCEPELTFAGLFSEVSFVYCLRQNEFQQSCFTQNDGQWGQNVTLSIDPPFIQ